MPRKQWYSKKNSRSNERLIKAILALLINGAIVLFALIFDAIIYFIAWLITLYKNRKK